MPQDPKRRGVNGMPADDYRRLQAQKAAKRKKKRQQQLIVLGAFALAIIILVVCIVLVIRSIFKKDGDTTTTTGIGTSAVGEGVGWPTAADRSAWNLWLINEQNTVEADFTRPEMERVVVNGAEYWFDVRMWPSLEQMIADCNSEAGYNLAFVVGFRSVERQEDKFQHYVDNFTAQGMSGEEARQEAKKYTEPGGAADNHTGLAVEFVVGGASETSAEFANSNEYVWLLKNAASYGFILRYPANKEAITGVPYKPWHWRYVGKEDAAAITGAGICLEEYLMTPSTAAPDVSGASGGTSLPESASGKKD